MAEILLARRVGPGGFERAVVIKRILPHLANLTEFVDMFLDEGRIAARIGHPNVSQVFALHQEDDELFQVMEYLEGESAAGVNRRLRSLNESLDYALAAHIVAEACAGLHAAHELNGPDGDSLELVHRDVSPENLFVGYDGTVKVLDFGIAKAANRLTKTDAGLIKGKFAYMSPEQTKGKALDRRSDIFSLGIVLYELSTQRSLFRRGNQPATLQAVNDDPVLPPSVFDPEYPRSLEAICLKALQRDPDERFSTAREMQRAILEILPALQGPTLFAESLAKLMNELFPDRISEKQEMMRRLQDGFTPSHVPAAEVDQAVEIPSVVVDLKNFRPQKTRHGWMVGSAALGVAGAVALATFLWRAPEAQIVEAAPVVDAAAPAHDDAVDLSLESEPPGARVYVGGALQGVTPVEVSLPASAEPAALRLEMDGYRTSDSQVVLDRDRTIRIALVPIPEEVPPPELATGEDSAPEVADPASSMASGRHSGRHSRRRPRRNSMAASAADSMGAPAADRPPPASNSDMAADPGRRAWRRFN
ncbi:MAG: protein kinase [Deltaproteobacteria bacterium]|nr:protein kinase [Deltaproteobacteria bacterium]